MNVKGKTVIVTGGANGIGFKYVEELLRNGAKSVAILDLANSKGDETVAKLEKEFGKGRAIFLVCDVTNAEQLSSSFKKAVDALHGLDILINNAGIMDDSRWELMIDINFTALVRATILALEIMGKENGGKGGTIVNIASVAGLHGADIVPIYGGTKHAVVGFSRGLKESYHKHGVRILVMCPGPTDTPLITDKSDRFIKVVGQNMGLSRLQQFYKQTPEHVAKAMVELIEKGKNGTICVSEDSKPLYAVNLGNYREQRMPL